jgi:hypothetical protein
VETFTELKDFVDNPHFNKQRQRSLRSLDLETIDPPLVDIIDGFSKLPYCFTLQSCYGHFLYPDQKNEKNIEPLPDSEEIAEVEYRIAYIALCIEDSGQGRELFSTLSEVASIDSEYIQFCSSDWFWKDQVNSFALQVEPDQYKTKDKCSVSYQEALHIEKVRNQFFNKIRGIVQKRLNEKP